MAWGTYEEEGNALRVLCRKLKDRDHFGHPGGNKRIILTRYVRMWLVFNWLRILGLFNRVMNL